MSHLFFIDESGTDGKMPYEIHGGIVVPLDRAWDMIRAMKGAQHRFFGCLLKDHGLEIKGERLLQKRIFKHARGINKRNPDGTRTPFVDETDRAKAARSFLEKNKAGERTLTAREFQAYGQSCLDLADEIFRIGQRHEVTIMAVAVDQDAPRPGPPEWDEMLRKDLVYLFERLYYYMDSQTQSSTAICIFDQKDDLDGTRCVEGVRLNDCIAKYFERSHTGRLRSSRILPEPLYARSDLTSLLGVADLAIYVINHAFRPVAQEWNASVREELQSFADWVYKMQWRGLRENQTVLYSVFHLSDLRPRSA